MQKIVTIWCHNRDYLLDEVCLHEAARWHAQLGAGDVDVLILRGFEIAREFADELGEYGYRLHDGSRIFEGLQQRYERIRSVYPEFLFMNFMRWLAIEEYFNPTCCACFDADLVLTSNICDDPAIEGATFTSTSTAFVVISNKNWFSGYRDLINVFNDSPDTFEQIWNEDVDENVLRLADTFSVNEETFVRFLVKTGRVPNSFPQCAYLIKPFLIELSNGSLPYSALTTPMTYERRSQEGDFLNGQPLAYVHFQNNFKLLLGMHLVYRHVFNGLVPQRLEPAFRLRNKTSVRPDIVALHEKLKELVIQGHFGHQHMGLFTRRKVMQEFLFESDLSGVFNDTSWHFPGVFAPPI